MGYKLKRILIYPDGVTEKQVYPKYEWKPGANTLLYLPLKEDATDQSGKSRSTSSSNISYGTLGGIQTAYNSSGNGNILVTPADIVVGSTEGTVSMLLYYTGDISEYRLAMNFNRYRSYGMAIGLYGGASTFWTNGDVGTIAYPGVNQWVHMLYTVDSQGSIAYINGVKQGEGAKTASAIWGDGSNSWNGYQYLFANRAGNNNYWKGGIREVIIESRKWSDEDVSNYYKWIKNKLGL